jgi:hypothetical protein
MFSPSSRAIQSCQYTVRRYRGPSGLCELVAELLQICLRGRIGLDEGGQSRMIGYCSNLDLLSGLSDALDCPMYAGNHHAMVQEEKEAALTRWLGPADSPVNVVDMRARSRL